MDIEESAWQVKFRIQDQQSSVGSVPLLRASMRSAQRASRRQFKIIPDDFVWQSFYRFSTLRLLFIAVLLACLHVLPARAAIEQNTVENYLQQSRLAGKKPNRLINENSPYLLQHAYNPVDWYPWGEEAFAAAKKLNRPIFLSIGYSTCHWCHVMEHESFENEAIAKLLNENFISIKIDREQRPDIDAVYMAATELINGSGGWPMTVILNNRLEPFHAATYYPPANLKDLLQKIVVLWRDERERVDAVAAVVTARISAQLDETDVHATLEKDVFERAILQLFTSYDESYGGFGSAPKFPMPGIYMLLQSRMTGADDSARIAGRMLASTLTAMAQGGIYDQVGGGFHRYSVDAQWQVPHFEKMLYTQALLASAYTRLYAVESSPLYRDIVTGTLDFVLREMASPEGGFYSALDADSERPAEAGNSHRDRGEGAYYLWSERELKSLLTDEQWAFIRDYYHVQPHGNIASDPRGEFESMNILHVDEAYHEKTLTSEQQKLLQQAKARLFEARQPRARPHLDDKIITAWNAMMITALVEASESLQRPDYLRAAHVCAEFIESHLVDKKTGALLRSLRGDGTGGQAGLDDYVWYVRAVLALYRHSGESKWLQRAVALSELQLRLFNDEANGGLYESAGDDKLLFRAKSVIDGALPASNAIAVLNFKRLAKLTGNKRWKETADEIVRAFAGLINQNPSTSAAMLAVLAETSPVEAEAERASSDAR